MSTGSEVIDDFLYITAASREKIRNARADIVDTLTAAEHEDQYHHSFLKQSVLIICSKIIVASTVSNIDFADFTNARQARIFGKQSFEVSRIGSDKEASISNKLILSLVRIGNILPKNGCMEVSGTMCFANIQKLVVVLLNKMTEFLPLSTLELGPRFVST